MSGVPDYTLEDTLDFKFTTRQFSTGAPFAFDSGAIEIYEDNSASQITGAETLTLEFDGVTGLHNLRVAATGANGFENGKSYQCVVSAGTVDSVSVVGEVVQQFSIGRSAAVAAFVTYGLDHLIANSVSDTDVADNSLWAELTDAGATSDYTNYSKTEDSQRAISEKVSSIGSASGGGLNFAAVGDDALTDTIDNLGVAVDKGTSPATVGIPVAGHAFKAGHECFLTGTDAYDGAQVIDSVSANEVVIVASFTGETFSSSDTIVSSIKGTSIEGTQTTNTFASTSSEDGVYHVIDDDDANNFTISYRYEIGGGRIATEAVFHGFLNGSNDNALLQAYNFVDDVWETRALLTGQNGSVNQTRPLSLLARNTGTSGVDLGVVFLRATDDTPRGSSNPTFNNDSFLVEAISIGQTAGYQNGQLWLDTNNGIAGTEPFVNGTADNPSLTWADILTLSASTGITDFHIINGSTVQLSASSNNYSLFGDNWTLDLNGQSVDGAHFEGAVVSGTFTGNPEFNHCTVNALTGPSAHLDDCALNNTITANAAGDWEFHNCHSNIAGSTTPIFDYGTDVGVSTNVTFSDYQNGIEFRNLNNQGTDLLSLSGIGQVIYAASCSGTVNQRGDWKETNTGGVTIVRDDNTTNVAAVLADTGTDGVLIAPAQGPVTFTGASDEAGITLVGEGTGPGLSTTGGATGHGIAAIGGSTSGDGINATADGGGKGMDLIGVGANAGLRTQGGATGPGIHAHGGSSGSTPGVEFHAHSTSGDALELEVDGSGDTNADLAAIKTVTDLFVAADAEPTGVPAANETPLIKAAYLFAALRNKVLVSATKKQFHDNAGAVLWEKDLDDDGNAYTESKANSP